VDDEVVAANRISWGGNGFSERQIEQYQLAPFLEEIPPEMIVVGERAMVTPSLRGTNLLFETMEHGRALVDDYDIHVVFGCCEPRGSRSSTGLPTTRPNAASRAATSSAAMPETAC